MLNVGKVGSCAIKKKIGDNSNKVELWEGFEISEIFNVKHLYDFRWHD